LVRVYRDARRRFFQPLIIRCPISRKR
jgi:hypothetical protein